MTFEEYIEKYEEELTIAFSESDEDRELDFDWYLAAEREYNKYMEI
jgi:hypothetical protein